MAVVAGRSTRSLTVMTKVFATGVFLATLPGCFPYVTSYVHLEAPGTKTTGGCAGPSVFATYEAHGARFDVTLAPGSVASRSNTGFLRVRAPQNMVVSMSEAVGYVTPEGQAPIRFELNRIDPWEDRFGREVLKRQGILEHRYEFSGLPPITFSGALKVPTLYLDGVAVASPPFKFDRRPWAGVVPLNC
jgi:hypothetical protein